MAFAVTTFTFQNKCRQTISPATLSGNRGRGRLELLPNAIASFCAPPGWSGRLWARTGCSFDPASPSGSCETGDCGGALRCAVGGATAVTLAEFTLAGPASGDKDFYDVSLVNVYNVGIGVNPVAEAVGGRVGGCRYTGCVADVNERCPADLRLAGASGETVACRSACEVFGDAEYCCTGVHGSPASCGRSRYSQLFKAAYSYAYNDATSTFTSAAGAAGYIHPPRSTPTSPSGSRSSGVGSEVKGK